LSFYPRVSRILSVKKYTNEKVRDSETLYRRKENKAYQELIEEEDKLLHDIHMAKNQYDYLKDTNGNIAIMVELMKLE